MEQFHCPVKTMDQCEALSLARIPLETRQQEAELWTSCWYDYRHLHPVQRTYLWTHEYVKAIQDVYRKTRDHARADKVHPFRGQDIFKTAEWLGAYKARQQLDRYGIRYDFALRFAMNRYEGRGWKVFPRPNQLCAEELAEDTHDAWKTECKAKLQIAEHDFYQSVQFVGHPDQIAYRDWLNKQIKTRAMVGWTLATPIAQGIYSTEESAAIFGPDATRQAAKLAAAMVSHP